MIFFQLIEGLASYQKVLIFAIFSRYMYFSLHIYSIGMCAIEHTVRFVIRLSCPIAWLVTEV